jgi:hypothetical protein
MLILCLVGPVFRTERPGTKGGNKQDRQGNGYDCPHGAVLAGDAKRATDIADEFQPNNLPIGKDAGVVSSVKSCHYVRYFLTK